MALGDTSFYHDLSLGALQKVSALKTQREGYNKQVDAQHKTNILSGALTGAATGFAFGGPIGAGVGAAAGLFLGFLS